MAQAAVDRVNESLSPATRRRIAMLRAERAAFAARRTPRETPPSGLRPCDFPYQPEIERHLAALRAATARDVAALAGLLTFLGACAIAYAAFDLSAALPV